MNNRKKPKLNLANKIYLIILYALMIVRTILVYNQGGLSIVFYLTMIGFISVT